LLTHVPYVIYVVQPPLLQIISSGTSQTPIRKVIILIKRRPWLPKQCDDPINPHPSLWLKKNKIPFTRHLGEFHHLAFNILHGIILIKEKYLTHFLFLDLFLDDFTVFVCYR